MSFVCNICEMHFEKYDQLQTHREKFCAITRKRDTENLFQRKPANRISRRRLGSSRSRMGRGARGNDINNIISELRNIKGNESARDRRRIPKSRHQKHSARTRSRRVGDRDRGARGESRRIKSGSDVEGPMTQVERLREEAENEKDEDLLLQLKSIEERLRNKRKRRARQSRLLRATDGESESKKRSTNNLVKGSDDEEIHMEISTANARKLRDDKKKIATFEQIQMQGASQLPGASTGAHGGHQAAGMYNQFMGGGGYPQPGMYNAAPGGYATHPGAFFGGPRPDMLTQFMQTMMMEKMESRRRRDRERELERRIEEMERRHKQELEIVQKTRNKNKSALPPAQANQLYKMIRDQINQTELLLQKHELENQKLTRAFLKKKGDYDSDEEGPQGGSGRKRGRMDPVAEMRMKQELEMAKLEFEKEKMLREKELADIKKKVEAENMEEERKMREAREKEEREKREAERLSKKKVQIEKAMTQGIDDEIYVVDGYVFFVDFILSFSPDVKFVRFVHGMFQKNAHKSNIAQTGLYNVDTKNGAVVVAYRKAYEYAKTRVPCLKVVLEIQKCDSLNATRQEEFSSVGWTVIQHFDRGNMLRSGNWRIPIYLAPVKSEVEPETVEMRCRRRVGVEIFCRLVEGRDIEVAKKVPINPQNAGSYMVPPGLYATQQAYNPAPDPQVDLKQLAQKMIERSNQVRQPGMGIPGMNNIAGGYAERLGPNVQVPIPQQGPKSRAGPSVPPTANPKEVKGCDIGILLDKLGSKSVPEEGCVSFRVSIVNKKGKAMGEDGMVFEWESSLHDARRKGVYNFQDVCYFLNHKRRRDSKLLIEVLAREDDEDTSPKVLHWVTTKLYSKNNVINQGKKLALRKPPVNWKKKSGHVTEAGVWVGFHVFPRGKEPHFEKIEDSDDEEEEMFEESQVPVSVGAPSMMEGGSGAEMPMDQLAQGIEIPPQSFSSEGEPHGASGFSSQGPNDVQPMDEAEEYDEEEDEGEEDIEEEVLDEAANENGEVNEPGGGEEAEGEQALDGDYPEGGYIHEPPVVDGWREYTNKGSDLHEQFFVPTKNPHTRTQFRLGTDNFIIYVDSARCLPDNMTISKVSLTLRDENFKKIEKDIQISAAMHADSCIYNPVFNLAKEIWKLDDPCTTVLFTIETVQKPVAVGDVVTHTPTVLGYCTLGLFHFINVDPDTREEINEQVTRDNLQTASEKKFKYFNEGCFQLPIYFSEVDFAKHFDPDKKVMKEEDKLAIVHNYDEKFSEEFFRICSKVPCASLLVRVKKNPIDPQTEASLRRNDIREEHWKSNQLDISPPMYEWGVYDSTGCEDTIIISPPYRSILEERKSVLGKEVFKNHSSQEEFSKIVKKHLKYNIYKAPIDYRYFSRYIPQEGFRLAVDGVQNLPRGTEFAKVIVHLSKRDNRFEAKEEPDEDLQIHWTEQSDLNSSQRCPRFLDDFYEFKKVDFKAGDDKTHYLQLLIEVVNIKKQFLKKKKSVKHIGFGVFNLFLKKMMTFGGKNKGSMESFDENENEGEGEGEKAEEDGEQENGGDQGEEEEEFVYLNAGKWLVPLFQLRKGMMPPSILLEELADNTLDSIIKTGKYGGLGLKEVQSSSVLLRVLQPEGSCNDIDVDMEVRHYECMNYFVDFLPEKTNPFMKYNSKTPVVSKLKKSNQTQAQFFEDYNLALTENLLSILPQGKGRSRYF